MFNTRFPTKLIAMVALGASLACSDDLPPAQTSTDAGNADTSLDHSDTDSAPDIAEP
ncbi:hypothetical protein [Lujinxingia litoralis]|uniref:hypothetical protein n=1 Tax=Lujinxingia litoralis TaxID=2211119 RepID=UPI00131436AC|nr:hypothetical protein [Lujinxingia litoralis]